ncbi:MULTISPECIES: DNA/RNA helicase domain-containing protein [unclassified Rathayibacter]|uniref:DNA/RNA helicase domain-containing protein n=1 Tax=unclassified Rathayibacter TaxID=2609250 RepID=UPI002B27B13B|nr:MULTISPECIES: DNA/RNA helicase domain-containing protein [unclassified Rathayibacter]
MGETRSASSRLRQHLGSPDKAGLDSARIIVDSTFNKSACLDLESFLIRLFAGDGQLAVLNRNEGIVDSDYYERASYRERFEEIFERLRSEGLFARSIPEIENDDLFKLSPFKALTQEQAVTVVELMEGLVEDRRTGTRSTSILQGEPGTGKTIVALYLLKLLVDIRAVAKRSDLAEEAHGDDSVGGDSVFSDFFLPGMREVVRDLRIGIVVPQQSLRKSIANVFSKTPGLSPTMVLTPFQVGEDPGHWDLLVVDESHRLTQRANQSSGSLNKKFTQITTMLFGRDDHDKTQLDWIRAKSDHQILLLDAAQTVRPADLPRSVIDPVMRRAAEEHRLHRLSTQMRVHAGTDFVAYIRKILDPATAVLPARPDFGEYDLRFFTDLAALRSRLREREKEGGLARLLAGYAWPWTSRHSRGAHDFEIDGEALRWNSTQTDWIAAPGLSEEVGSIHTVQGYDLNYAGVIIGPDLRWDEREARLAVSRKDYHDKKGKENNRRRMGRDYTDDELLQFVVNIYAVLLTRGMLGTYVYVCDPALRERLRAAFERRAHGLLTGAGEVSPSLAGDDRG